MVINKIALFKYSLEINLSQTEAVERLRQITIESKMDSKLKKDVSFDGKIGDDDFFVELIRSTLNLRPVIKGYFISNNAQSTTVDVSFRLPLFTYFFYVPIYSFLLLLIGNYLVNSSSPQKLHNTIVLLLGLSVPVLVLYLGLKVGIKDAFEEFEKAFK